MPTNQIGKNRNLLALSAPDRFKSRLAKSAMSQGLSESELIKYMLLERLQSGKPLRYERMRPKDLAKALSQAAEKTLFISVFGILTFTSIIDAEDMQRRKPRAGRPIPVRVCKANRKPGKRGENSETENVFYEVAA